VRRGSSDDRVVTPPMTCGSAPGGSRTPNLLIRSQVRLNGVRSSVSAGRVRALCAELSPVVEQTSGPPDGPTLVRAYRFLGRMAP
jgi:hypothetical protein